MERCKDQTTSRCSTSFKLARAGLVGIRAAGILLLLVSPYSKAVNLLDVFELSVVSDPEYLSAASANRASQEIRPQALAALLPNVSAEAGISGNVQEIERSGSGTTGTSTFYNRQFVLSATQPIYRKDLWVGLKQADTRIAQANTEYAFARQELILRVSQRYFDVLSAADELTFANAELEAFSQQLEQSKQRFDVGLIAITDVEESQAGFDLARAQVLASENQLDNAREALREVSGEYFGELDSLGAEVPLAVPEPDDIDEWTEISLTQNLSLSAARYASETARDEIKRIEAGHLPQLDLVGQHDRARTTADASSSNDAWNAQIGFRLNVPIYEGGAVLSQTRESRHLYQQALDDMERQRRATQRQTREAFLGVRSEILRVQALEQAVRSTEAAVEAVEAGFQVGTRTSVDVLDAERDLFAAKRDLSAARYNYIINTLTLKQAAGTLSEEDLSLVNSWLNLSK